MDISVAIEHLLDYAETALELPPRDRFAARNALYSALGVTCAPAKAPCRRQQDTPDGVLAELFDALIEPCDRDAVADAAFGALILSPSAVEDRFSALLNKSAKSATDWFYSYCVKADYVKKSRLDKNIVFESNGYIISINKAKPEFRDPKAAAAQTATGYPSCVICRENEGLAAKNKRTLRTVTLKLGGEEYFWQYSPFGYFNEHGIAVNAVHKPMYVDRTTFDKLFDFVDMFPHYFLGCNAALPRVGGSILAHDHFQGGRATLPLHVARPVVSLAHRDFGDTAISVLDWNGTALRISGSDRRKIAEVAEIIRRGWVSYDNAALGIVAEDGDGVHNAISPTALKTKDGYAMIVILRNNVTSAQYPDGVFHVRPQFHCIKKESIGLIEAQGLFILPGRLENELGRIYECVKSGASLDGGLEQFGLVYDEVKALCGKNTDGDNVKRALAQELGSVCARMLKDTAVFKSHGQTADFLKGLGFYESR